MLIITITTPQVQNTVQSSQGCCFVAAHNNSTGLNLEVKLKTPWFRTQYRVPKDVVLLMLIVTNFLLHNQIRAPSTGEDGLMLQAYNYPILCTVGGSILGQKPWHSWAAKAYDYPILCTWGKHMPRSEALA